MKAIIVAMILALAALTSCAYLSSPTPYQRAQGLEGGYWDVHIADDIYMVKFAGNFETPRHTIKAYFYRRSQEVCAEHGYRDFEFFSQPPDVLENVYWSKIRCVY